MNSLQSIFLEENDGNPNFLLNVIKELKDVNSWFFNIKRKLEKKYGNDIITDFMTSISNSQTRFVSTVRLKETFLIWRNDKFIQGCYAIGIEFSGDRKSKKTSYIVGINNHHWNFESMEKAEKYLIDYVSKQVEYVIKLRNTTPY